VWCYGTERSAPLASIASETSNEITTRSGEVRIASDRVRITFFQKLDNSKSLDERWHELKQKQSNQHQQLSKHVNFG
jgi:hypothetical protein